ncbi:hypothetical protein NA57DRAFT_59728 [Rhizodiscina lignyota]|uniref:FHA domain-containing protein n=1 Tax=Rhizodiscina lignyota TaxID=1504668 RepID=A0A9P4IB97_9PEZI|nr:hypothetical protein NA57DRAFT_59728 [Rhizodiscina lignyota]
MASDTPTSGMMVQFTLTEGKDDLKHRYVTLTEMKTIEVGRSSKSATKQLIAATNNCWVNNPVISRSHARLSVEKIGVEDTEKMQAFIRDTGSMHGTFLNGKKIEEGKNHRLITGDILQFGTDVTRGDDTFKAPKYEVTVFPLNDDIEESNHTPPSSYFEDFISGRATSSEHENGYRVPDSDSSRAPSHISLADSDSDSDSDDGAGSESSAPIIMSTRKESHIDSPEAAEASSGSEINPIAIDDTNADANKVVSPIAAWMGLKKDNDAGILIDIDADEEVASSIAESARSPSPKPMTQNDDDAGDIFDENPRAFELSKRKDTSCEQEFEETLPPWRKAPHTIFDSDSEDEINSMIELTAKPRISTPQVVTTERLSPIPQVQAPAPMRKLTIDDMLNDKHDINAATGKAEGALASASAFALPSISTTNSLTQYHLPPFYSTDLQAPSKVMSEAPVFGMDSNDRDASFMTAAPWTVSVREASAGAEAGSRRGFPPPPPLRSFPGPSDMAIGSKKRSFDTFAHDDVLSHADDLDDELVNGSIIKTLLGFNDVANDDIANDLHGYHTRSKPGKVSFPLGLPKDFDESVITQREKPTESVPVSVVEKMQTLRADRYKAYAAFRESMERTAAMETEKSEKEDAAITEAPNTTDQVETAIEDGAAVNREALTTEERPPKRARLALAATAFTSALVGGVVGGVGAFFGLSALPDSFVGRYY